MISDRRSLGVMIAGAAAFFDLYAPQAILPQLAKTFGITAAQSGWVITVTTLAVAVVGPFAGALADALGRKRLIAASALFIALPTMLVATSGSFAELLMWRAAAGLLMPLIFCVTIAYIAEEWDGGKARAVTGLYMAGAVAGGFLGRFATGVFTDLVGWRLAFVGLGALNFLIGLGLVYLLPRERAFVSSGGVGAALLAMLAHLRRPRMLAACGVGFLILFAQVALFTYATLLLAGPPYALGPALLASVSAVYLLGMVTTPLAGHHLLRFGERVPLAVGASLFIAGVGLTLLPSLPAIIAGLAVASAGTFLSQSAATSFVAANAQRGRSAALGIYTTWYYVGGSVGAAGPGAAWHAAGWPGVVALLIAANLAALLIAALCWRMPACERSAAQPAAAPAPIGTANPAVACGASWTDRPAAA